MELDADTNQEPGRAARMPGSTSCWSRWLILPLCYPPDEDSALVDQDRVEVTITATQQNENPTIDGLTQYTIEENTNLPTTPDTKCGNVHGGWTWMHGSNINWDLEGADEGPDANLGDGRPRPGIH